MSGTGPPARRNGGRYRSPVQPGISDGQECCQRRRPERPGRCPARQPARRAQRATPCRRARQGVGRPAAAPSRAPVPQDLQAGVLNSAAWTSASVLSAEAQAGQQPSAGRCDEIHGHGRGPSRFGGRQLPAACQRSLARRCEHHARPHGRPDPQQRLQHPGHRQPGPFRQPRARSRPPAAGDSSSHPEPRAQSSWPDWRPGQEQLSVQVRSAGGPVAAVIQQSVLRGLTPGGVDFIVPGTAPAARQVMTGVDIQDAGGLAALTGKARLRRRRPGSPDHRPGSADAVVEIKLFGRDGQKALPGGGVVTAKAGAVTEVSLAGVPAGHYTVPASSDVSFTAAARVTRGVTPRCLGRRVVAGLRRQAGKPACCAGARTAATASWSSVRRRAGPRFPTRRSPLTARSGRPRPRTSPAEPLRPSRSRPTSTVRRWSAYVVSAAGEPPTAPSLLQQEGTPGHLNCRRGARGRGPGTGPGHPGVLTGRPGGLSSGGGTPGPGIRAARRASPRCAPPRRRARGPGVPPGCRTPAPPPAGTA